MGKNLSISLPLPASPSFLSISLEDKSEGDCLHQWGYQDHPRNKEQNHLQAEWADGKGSEEDRALAQRWPSVYLRWDERHQCPLLGDGAEASWGIGDHISETVAERAAGFQAVLSQHPQTAVLVALALPASLAASVPSSLGLPHLLASAPLSLEMPRAGDMVTARWWGRELYTPVHRLKCNKQKISWWFLGSIKVSCLKLGFLYGCKRDFGLRFFPLHLW